MNCIDKETHSKIVEFLDSREIRAIGLDVDNTLFHTSEYYRNAMSKLGVELATEIDNSRDPEVISKEINNAIFLEYKKDGRKPRLINKIYLSGLREYLGYDVPKDMQRYVVDFYKDFYLKSPKPFQSAPQLIKTLFDCGRKIVLHSHAQEEWTKIKVNFLEELTGYTLPYLSTPITATKDSKSWIDAFDIVKTDIANTLVIGDNFEADIRPPMEAGSKCLVWMNRYKGTLPQDLNIEDNVELIVIDDVGKVISHLSTLV